MLPGIAGGMMAAAAAAVAGVADITIVDDGDAAPSSGTGTATHTYNSQTSTGPSSVVALTWFKSGANTTLSSITWGGVSMSILVQSGTVNASGDNVGAAICIIAGAQSGNIIATFSGSTGDSEITKVSLDNLQNLTAVDTDAAANDLSALLSPGAGGIRIGASANNAQSTAVSWTNAIEIADLSIGSSRHSAAYDLGDDGGTISCTGSPRVRTVGVSLR